MGRSYRSWRSELALVEHLGPSPWPEEAPLQCVQRDCPLLAQLNLEPTGMPKFANLGIRLQNACCLGVVFQTFAGSRVFPL